MKPLNIAIAVPKFPNLVQTYIVNQLISLRTKSINISIIASDNGSYSNLPANIIKNNLLELVIYIKANNIIQVFRNLFSLPVFNKEYRHAIKSILLYKSRNSNGRYFRLKSLIRARAVIGGPYDILHSHSMFTSFNLMFMKKILSIPLVTTYHGCLPKGVKRLDDWKMSVVFEGSDAFLTNTIFAKNELVKLGCPISKIYSIPQGISLDDFEFRNRIINLNEEIRLISVGRLSPEKGHHTALLAINEIIIDYPKLKYHIIGNGPEKARLEEECARLNLSNQVVFHGFKTGKALNKILEIAHIFVLPSISETQGVVIQEAQACGIPVIANNTGGIPEVIHDNKTGLLYKENDHMDLAYQINKLITNPMLYQNLCNCGYNDVKNRFDIDIVSQRLIDFYYSVIENN